MIQCEISSKRGYNRWTKAEITEMEYLLTLGGYTFEEVGEKYDIDNRQYVAQLMQRHCINVVENRKPIWYAVRCGIVKLADKDWLEKQLVKHNGSKNLARKLQLSQGFINNQARRLKINLELLLPSEPEKITRPCTICKKKITRLKTKFPESGLVFCNKKCMGEWMGKKNHGRSHDGGEWTHDELQFLVNNHIKMMDRKIALALGKTKKQVYYRRHRMGLLKRPGKRD